MHVSTTNIEKLSSMKVPAKVAKVATLIIFHLYSHRIHGTGTLTHMNG